CRGRALSGGRRRGRPTVVAAVVAARIGQRNGRRCSGTGQRCSGPVRLFNRDRPRRRATSRRNRSEIECLKRLSGEGVGGNDPGGALPIPQSHTRPPWWESVTTR